jgi:Na+/H+ antiporter NhaD/arsenite permease-like protein
MTIAGISLEFFLFGLTLLGVALFHHFTLEIALAGLASITLYKLALTGFHEGPGFLGLVTHIEHEWVTLANLFCLLIGFAMLARHFEESNVPEAMPAILPDDWKGGFMLLVLVFILSGFLDNIAAALIGGTVAKHVYRNRLHIGFLAAIVAASNAGGAGSVVGDTTTTMMWIAGVSPLSVVHAYLAAAVALLVFGIPASIQQDRYNRIVKDMPPGIHIDWLRVMVVFVVLVAAISANVFVNLAYPELLDHVPVIGLAVVGALVLTAPVRYPDISILPATLKGTVFLLSLVLCASMMPVEELPAPAWQTAFVLGFVSSIFDNIPLTSMALHQGGYDWALLAYAVGFGGSMIWFGSSAGVALTNIFPQGRSAIRWITGGWHVPVAYVIGFMVMLTLLGWNPA